MSQISLQIRFDAMLFRLEEDASGMLLALPGEASATLSSRGIAMVEGTLNGISFRAVCEPDGKGSHWLPVSDVVLQASGADCGDTVSVAIVPTDEWLEPIIPAELEQSLMAEPQAHVIWTQITPSARWDWIRWIGSARQSETRTRRMESVGSRLRSGKRRPCCFDRTRCTLTRT